ncbi:MAG: type III pantothenate kinase [Steroidobacteraceae bacterium]
MKLLLVDIGNTRLKWAVLADGMLGKQRALAMQGANAREFAKALGAMRGVAAVVAVNVAGTSGEQLLRAALRLLQLPAPRMIRSTRRAGGVANGYPDAWRLGADRWVAVVGAHDLARGRPVCVADIGTAMTLDLVDAHGRHRGGQIVPGPELMRRSLLNDTGGIRRRASVALPRATGFFARNTAAALQVGPTQACAALIDRSVQEARVLLGAKPLLLLTGGGAQGVARALRSSHELRQDLVLHGLAVLARVEAE